MVEINGKVITIVHKKYKEKYIKSILIWLFLITIVIFKFVRPIQFLIVCEMLVFTIIGVHCYFFKKNNIDIEKMKIEEKELVIQGIRSDNKILYSQKIILSEIEKIYFEDTFGAYFSKRGPEYNTYLEKQQFLKIATFSKKIYSFGFLINYQEFEKINRVLNKNTYRI